jgi:diguanylate cyclase (GGDEF)-like protein
MKRKVPGALIFIVAVFLIWATVNEALVSRNDGTLFRIRIFSEDRIEDFSRGWTYSGGGKADITELGVQMTDDGVSRSVVRAELPEKISDDTYLMFRSANIFFDVYVDGEKIYDYDFRPSVFAGNSYGVDYHSVRIKPSYAGKTITIKTRLPYKNSGSFQNMSIGGAGAFMCFQLDKYFGDFIISMFIFLFGFITLYIASSLEIEKNIRDSFRGFSFTSILFGLWSLGESQVSILFTGNAELWRCFAYPPLMLLPYTVMLMTRGWLGESADRAIRITRTLVIIDCVACLFAYIFTGNDCHHMKPLILTILLGSILLILFIIFRSIAYEIRSHEVGRIVYIAVGIIILLFCVIWDFYDYVVLGRTQADCASHTRVGYAFAMLLISVQYLKLLSTKIHRSTKADAYRRMALIDELTGIGNRQAWSYMMERLEKGTADGTIDEVLLGSVDLNNLKHVNDTYGHHMGDEYIISAAEVLSSTLDGIGSVYRIGGDEFVLEIDGAGAQARFDSVLPEIKEKALSSAVSMAWGTEVWKKDDPRTLEDVFDEADRKMYRMKEAARKNS